jgi:hypothetical protein
MTLSLEVVNKRCYAISSDLRPAARGGASPPAAVPEDRARGGGMGRFAWRRTDGDDAKPIVVLSWKPQSGEPFAVVVDGAQHLHSRLPG